MSENIKNEERLENAAEVEEAATAKDEQKHGKKRDDKSVSKKDFDKLKSEADDYKDRWMRSVAEFDNYKKRNATLWQDAFFEGKKEAVLKILSIGDNLETAIGMIPDEKSREGVEKLLKQFVTTLENMEVKAIDPTGEQFDPENAEAVMQAEPTDESDQSGYVKATFRKGYSLNGKIIRYAQVSVIK